MRAGTPRRFERRRPSAEGNDQARKAKLTTAAPSGTFFGRGILFRDEPQASFTTAITILRSPPTPEKLPCLFRPDKLTRGSLPCYLLRNEYSGTLAPVISCAS